MSTPSPGTDRPILARLNSRGFRLVMLLDGAAILGLAVGSMWAAYLFAFLALFALPDAFRQGTYFMVVWLSSSFLQLVLLRVIIVGQNI